MDRNFDIDDFERLLREKSDEFRMYPSKRIWHSIYNNIHPGRKWPSVAMSIMLITALLLMGYLNTKNTNLYASGKNVPPAKIIAQSSKPVSLNPFDNSDKSNISETGTISNGTSTIVSNSTLSNDKINAANYKLTHKISPAENFAIAGQPSISDDNRVLNNSQPGINTSTKKETDNSFTKTINLLPELLANEKIETSGNAKDDKLINSDDQREVLMYAQKTPISDLIETLLPNDLSIKENKKTLTAIQGGNSAVEKNNLTINKKNSISAEDKEWIENYALYNRPATKKWANKLAWQMYATPSVVYRRLYSDPNFGTTLYNNAPLAISSNGNINKAVIQKPSIGLEIGTALQYSIFKGVKLKAGLQLNYTRYNSEAFQNTHPVSTKLTMHDYETNTLYEVYRTTPYSNKTGLEATKLHNETFQISLPIGADLKVIGNDNLQWNMGLTIQPTYVPGGKSYLISSDKRNYVRETSMLNRWNLNAGFETFISYKADNGLTYQIGPQFRSQLLSTNNKQFAVQEKLLTYGLKFGISKTLK